MAAMPILNIRHLTTYRYRKPVAFGEHRLRMRPQESYDQRVLSWALAISPAPELRYVHDVLGNCVGVARFGPARADTLSFESRVTLEHHPAPLATDAGEAIGPCNPAFPFAYPPEELPDLMRSIERQHADPGGVVAAWARRFLRWNGPTPVLRLLAEMTCAVPREFAYAQRLEAGTQTPAETLARRAGTCRDFAGLMIEAARSLGLAARFVSGYIYASAGKGAPTGGGHTHAWVQVYLPSCGWVEFDPTNGIVGNRDLVRVAVVRDPLQALPLTGAWEGDAEDFLGMEVEVELTPQAEPQTVTGLAPQTATGTAPQTATGAARGGRAARRRAA